MEGWKNLGNKDWNYETFEKALRTSFILHEPSGTIGDGPLQLALAAPDGFWEKAWIEGLESVGLTRCDPFSGHVCGPVISAESIDPTKKQRSFAANVYLDPVRSRPNLTVLTEATVTKVLIERYSPSDDAIAKGVQFISKDGVTQSIAARKEVIISAGAINS